MRDESGQRKALFALARVLRHAWSAATSGDSKWSKRNVALGQCAVTALIVQDYLGGTLLRGVVNGGSHYWNLLSDGSMVDLTRQQFGSVYVQESMAPFIRSRESVLAYPDTAARYFLLRERVDQLLAEESDELQGRYQRQAAQA